MHSFSVFKIYSDHQLLIRICTQNVVSDLTLNQNVIKNPLDYVVKRDIAAFFHNSLRATVTKRTPKGHATKITTKIITHFAYFQKEHTLMRWLNVYEEGLCNVVFRLTSFSPSKWAQKQQQLSILKVKKWPWQSPHRYRSLNHLAPLGSLQ